MRDDPHTYAERRRDHAWWYAAGRQDTGETVDPFAFATLARQEAYAYASEQVVSLASVQDQYERFTA